MCRFFYSIYIDTYIHIYPEPIYPLFWALDPQKQCLLYSKTWLIWVLGVLLCTNMHYIILACINIFFNSCKWWYPQNTPKWLFLVGKTMVVGYHHFRKPPYHHCYSFNQPQRIPTRLATLPGPKVAEDNGPESSQETVTRHRAARCFQATL